MILVTGGAGLVGAELISQLLQRQEKVTAITHHTLLPDFNSENLTVVKCDILDTSGLEEVMKGIRQVYHCAALVSFDPKNKNELFKVVNNFLFFNVAKKLLTFNEKDNNM